VVGGLSEFLGDFSTDEFDCSFAEFFEVGLGWGLEALRVFSCRGISVLRVEGWEEGFEGFVGKLAGGLEESSSAGGEDVHFGREGEKRGRKWKMENETIRNEKQNGRVYEKGGAGVEQASRVGKAERNLGKSRR